MTGKKDDLECLMNGMRIVSNSNCLVHYNRDIELDRGTSEKREE
jgi:hypothetical protein